MIVAIIVACEIGFWVLLGLGLIARYALRLPRISAAILISVPVVDVVLLAATVIDLSRGATASAAHGLAAAYIAFSVVYGHRTIASIDARVAHRFANGPPPTKVVRVGGEKVAYEWQSWGRAAVAWAIASALLGGAILIVGVPDRTSELLNWLISLTALLGVWLLVGPVRCEILHRFSRPAQG